jgi:hypothetical protein
MNLAVVVETFPFTVDVKTKEFVEVETTKVFIVFDALIAARELLASALRDSGPDIVVVPFSVVLVAVNGPEIFVVAKFVTPDKFVVPVAVKLPVVVFPKFAIDANKFVKFPVIEFKRFAKRFVVVAFVAVKLFVFVVDALTVFADTELNTGLLLKE